MMTPTSRWQSRSQRERRQSSCWLVATQTPKRVLAELEGFQGTVLRTNLSAEDGAKFREAFGEEVVAEPGSGQGTPRGGQPEGRPLAGSPFSQSV